MKRLLLLLFLSALISQPSFAFEKPDFLNFSLTRDEKAVRKVLNSQIRYANKGNFDKFINTFDESYLNSDGFNLETYSQLVSDIWNTYTNIRYKMDFESINIKNNNAEVNVVETSTAKLPLNEIYEGELNSIAYSTYYLRKTNGTWKVYSDSISDETTQMLYGQAKDLDIKLTVPTTINAGEEYTATLEFTPPEDTMAIASIASDIVEYPQKPTKEVFRPLPNDNILERMFTANTQNANEYIVASIGLTKAVIKDLSIKLSLTGFGYTIKRVNVTKESHDSI